MQISSTELKTHLGEYLKRLGAEDIIITKNGRKIAKLVKEEDDMLTDMRSLFGILAESMLSGMTDDQFNGVLYEERNKRYECAD